MEIKNNLLGVDKKRTIKKLNSRQQKFTNDKLILFKAEEEINQFIFGIKFVEIDSWGRNRSIIINR